MINEEQLQRLKRSVAEWNQWRSQDLNLRPDLSGAGLSIADLHDATLSGADLRGADLHEANLNGVNLTNANVSQADLRGIPWLVIRELTLQPGIIWKDVRYDRMSDE